MLSYLSHKGVVITAELSTLFQAIYFSMCTAFQRRPTLLASRIPQYQRLAHMYVGLCSMYLSMYYVGETGASCRR